MAIPTIPFPEYKSAWLEGISDEQSPTEKGRKFAHRIVIDWMETADISGDVYDCDGCKDGGIDLAILQKADDAGEDGSSTWYIVQSKYGTAFQSVDTIVTEGLKVISTLTDETKSLNSMSDEVISKIRNFVKSENPNDRIVLVYAVEDNLTQNELSKIEDVKTFGRAKLDKMFDAEVISIEMIYNRLKDTENSLDAKIYPLKSDLKSSGADILVGVVSIIDLYKFLKTYKDDTNDIDRIYERNVRKFLSSKGKVNSKIRETLEEDPELFGLYNNGVTIVVSNYEKSMDGWLLTDPYIVNGCQSTKTIWNVCDEKLGSGATKPGQDVLDWQTEAQKGVVIVKVVRVDHRTEKGEALLENITRYTNSQNAVKDRDFIALEKKFQSWQKEIGAKFGLYLEVQRGGIAAEKNKQKKNLISKKFNDFDNAFELLKVLGAGWLGEAGAAFGKNEPFAPGGEFFNSLLGDADKDNGIGVDDLFAAYLLKNAASAENFGRGGVASRRLSKFLFYMIVIELFKPILQIAGIEDSRENVSMYLIKALQNDECYKALIGQATTMIDGYFDGSEDNCVYKEPYYVEKYDQNINAYLKSETFGKNSEVSPRFRDALSVAKQVMKKGSTTIKPATEIIASHIAS